MSLRLATRRSPLALAQADAVARRLGPLGVECAIVPVTTSGDRDATSALAALGGQGVFAVEVQRAVLEGRADVAVHSAKDLPSASPEGLVLASVPERRDPADVLVGRTLAGLGPGATVATGSPRRRALLLERRPDLRVVGLRGNMATRLGAAGRDGVDAVVAAAAALERLGVVPVVVERLETGWFVPQVGQGALALEAREGDRATREALAGIDDAAAHRAVLAERSFLAELGAGCAVPVGAHATAHADALEIVGVMLDADGAASVRASRRGADPVVLGRDLARHLRDDLGGGTLTAVR